MADSYLDIDIANEYIFPLSINWLRQPTNAFVITRYLQTFPGTSQQINTLNEQTPITFEGTFSIYNKSDEYDLVSFIHERIGRVGRFWIPYPKQLFRLYEKASVGATSLSCVLNGADLSYQGYERVYILMKTGDIITRKVDSVTNDGIKISLNLHQPIDRDIELDNYIQIGRFLLARFDSDKFDLEIETNNVFEYASRFVELVKEYAELEDD